MTVRLIPAKRPSRARIVIHDDTPREDDVDEYDEDRPQLLEVVLYDRAEDGDDPQRRIRITELAGGVGGSWPWACNWGEALTPAEAVRLAEMLAFAAQALIGDAQAAASG